MEADLLCEVSARAKEKASYTSPPSPWLVFSLFDFGSAQEGGLEVAFFERFGEP